ncbi:hypothetical protein EDB81DRAFT_771668 [Dactylonectria macrodidyma]|uniref:Velvet domain-containing protein n=1 Tax=Dactylonectria macrodidyma TaxID=307937 RepID=A0A9P9JNC0_9HYPO|nr:hypothetical protein EDB81DRAFT_771668 [Dactylonectria macrodidyma]
MANRGTSDGAAGSSMEPEESIGRAGVSIDHPGGDDTHPRIILKFRQQPMSAQVRRLGSVQSTSAVDQMPIIQLVTEGLELPNEQQHCDRHIVFCTATSTTGAGAGDQRPMEPVVSGAFIGKDEHGVEGCFVSFPNLSFNCTGTFRLTFKLVTIEPGQAKEGAFFPVLSMATTDVITVYSADRFPGVRAPTALTKALMEGRVVPPSKHDDWSDGESSGLGVE